MSKDSRRVSWDEADEIVKKIREAFGGLAIICGSFRRKRETVGDIDLVFMEEDRRELGTSLLKIADPQSEHYNKKDQKLKSVKIDGVRVELYGTDQSGLGAAILYATGSGDWNVHQRIVAKRKGMMLSQHGLFNRDTGERICGKTEEEIFDKLGMRFVNPEDREKGISF